MKDQTETRPRIRVRKTEMDFQDKGNLLTAVHPFYYDSKSPRELQALIKNEGYREPTSAELTSFVHEYFDGSEPQAQEITDKLEMGGYFIGFTGILYVPEERVAHFIDFPVFDENSIVDKDDLLRRIDESRAQVDFKDLRKSSVEWGDVKNHPYFVAWSGGNEGAEKLAELVSKQRRKKGQNETARFRFQPSLGQNRQKEKHFNWNKS